MRIGLPAGDSSTQLVLPDGIYRRIRSAGREQRSNDAGNGWALHRAGQGGNAWSKGGIAAGRTVSGARRVFAQARYEEGWVRPGTVDGSAVEGHAKSRRGEVPRSRSRGHRRAA